MDASKYIEKTFLSENELIDRAVKTRTLNAIAGRIGELSALTTNESIMGFIDSCNDVLEDAHKIDMYKFQFKLLTLIISKELDNIEQMVKYE